MGGHDQGAAAGAERVLQVFEADDAVRRQTMGRRPPGAAGFEHPEGQRVIVGEGEAAPFGSGQFRESETEIGRHDPPADGDKIVDEDAEHGGETAL